MNDIVVIALYSFLTASLLIASYYDIKKRRIWYLIFVPAFAISLLINVIFYNIVVFSILSLLLFSLLFFATNTRVFIAGSSAISAVGAILIFYMEPDLLMPWIVEIVFANMVIGEFLFGVGDIKALILVIFSTAPFYLSLPYSIISLPFSILFFLNLGFSSIAATIYSLYYTYMKTGTFSYRAKVKDKDKFSEIAFKSYKRNGNTYVTYNIPFTLFITIAFILTSLSVYLSILM